MYLLRRRWFRKTPPPSPFLPQSGESGLPTGKNNEDIPAPNYLVQGHIFSSCQSDSVEGGPDGCGGGVGGLPQGSRHVTKRDSR